MKQPLFARHCRLFLALLVIGWGGVSSISAPASPWLRDAPLSQLLVKRMVTDAAGFRWVATSKGVFRYDGYELVPLQQLVRSGDDVPAQVVWRVVLDRAGRLWLTGQYGLFCFTPRTGRFRAIPLPAMRLDIAPGTGELLVHPRTGHLWVSYEDNVIVLDPEHGGRPLGPPRKVGGSATYIQPDLTGAGVWISLFQPHWPVRRNYTEGRPGVVQLGATGPPRFRLTTDCFVVPVPGTHPLEVFSASARFTLDAAGHLQETDRWLPAGHEDNFVLSNAPPDSVREWVSQGYRIRLVVRGPRVGFVAVEPLALGTAPPDYRHSYVLEQDPFGVEWCYSQYWRGCYKQPVARPRAVQPVLLASGRPTPSTRAIVRLPDGRLLVGAYGGPLVQAADSPNAPLRPLAVTQNGRPRLPLGYGLLVARTGEVVFAEDGIGFSWLNPRTGERHDIAFPGQQKPATARCVALLEDRAGHLWGGTRMGLFRLLLRPGRAVAYAHGPAAASLAKLEINGLAEDPGTGHLWLATTTGLYLLQPAAGTLRRIGERGQPGHPLPTEEMLCVTSAGAGRAWVGTTTAGLLLADARTGLVQQVGLVDGLPSLTVVTVLRAPGGPVWAGTYAGLVRYEPTTQRLAVLTEADGLADAELNRNSAFADPATGALWFGGVGGLHRVWPNAPTADRYAPARLLVTATAGPAPGGGGDSSIVVRQLAGYQLPQLRLGAGPEAFVELRLALSNLSSPDLTRYAYRFARVGEGRYSPWLPTTRRLVLRTLPAGDYTVEVRAETVTGQPATNTVRVALHVARVWWQHPLAWLLAAGGLVGIAYGLFWLQGRQARHDAHLREELAANLHDEVGALLTRINFQVQLLREEHRHPVASAPDATGGFDRLLHNSQLAVQTMRDVVWSIDATADSVGALLDRMRDQLDQLADSTGLALTLHTSGLPDSLALPPALRQHLYLIFKEALTNAVRHATTATTIAVRLTRQTRVVELEIVDDGAYVAPARPPARPASGLGLRTMRQRAQAIKGELQTGARLDGKPGYRVWVRVRW